VLYLRRLIDQNHRVTGQEITEFEKQRIGVSLAMLGALLALHEIVGGFGTRGVPIFGWFVQFRHMYFGLALVLAFAVYCFALGFLSSRVWRFARIAGSVLYIAALTSPPVLFMFWAVSRVHAPSEGWVKWFTSGVFFGFLSTAVIQISEFLRKRRHAETDPSEDAEDHIDADDGTAKRPSPP
jgi:hypothetical protein